MSPTREFCNGMAFNFMRFIFLTKLTLPSTKTIYNNEIKYASVLIIYVYQR